MLKMNATPSPDVIPNPHSSWMLSADHRKAILEKICQQVFDSFIDFSFGQTSRNNDINTVKKSGKQLLGIGCFYLEFTDAIHSQ